VLQANTNSFRHKFLQLTHGDFFPRKAIINFDLIVFPLYEGRNFWGECYWERGLRFQFFYHNSIVFAYLLSGFGAGSWAGSFVFSTG
jgi:hypothetical protein